MSSIHPFSSTLSQADPPEGDVCLSIAKPTGDIALTKTIFLPINTIIVGQVIIGLLHLNVIFHELLVVITPSVTAHRSS